MSAWIQAWFSYTCIPLHLTFRCHTNPPSTKLPYFSSLLVAITAGHNIPQQQQETFLQLPPTDKLHKLFNETKVKKEAQFSCKFTVILIACVLVPVSRWNFMVDQNTPTWRLNAASKHNRASTVFCTVMIVDTYCYTSLLTSSVHIHDDDLNQSFSSLTPVTNNFHMSSSVIWDASASSPFFLFHSIHNMLRYAYFVANNTFRTTLVLQK